MPCHGRTVPGRTPNSTDRRPCSEGAEDCLKPQKCDENTLEVHVEAATTFADQLDNDGRDGILSATVECLEVVRFDGNMCVVWDRADRSENGIRSISISNSPIQKESSVPQSNKDIADTMVTSPSPRSDGFQNATFDQSRCGSLASRDDETPLQRTTRSATYWWRTKPTSSLKRVE